MQETTLRQDNTNRIRTLQAARFLFILLIYLSHSVEPLAHSPFDFGGEGGVANGLFGSAFSRGAAQAAQQGAAVSFSVPQSAQTQKRLVVTSFFKNCST